MDLRTLLVTLTLLGAALTIGGLVAAWRGAGREFSDAQARVEKMEELAKAELDEVPPPAGDADRLLIVVRADDKWDEIYAEHGLTRPTYDNMVFLAAYESRRLLGLVLKSTSRDFLIAAFGLLVSTGASVGSLFLVS